MALEYNCGPILQDVSTLKKVLFLGTVKTWNLRVLRRSNTQRWKPGWQRWCRMRSPRTSPLCTDSPSACCCSVAQSCLTLCDPTDCSTPGLPVLHCLPEFSLTHVHRVSGAIQPSHPLSSPSPPTLNLSQHQGLFQWVSSLHQVAKGLEFQLQHQSFQRIFRVDFL